MKPLVIAIDGPSGAGKGTVARAVASALGYRHVDSGAMYRAVGWKALRDGVPLDDEAAVAALADQRAHRRHQHAGHDRRRRRHARDPHAGDRSRGRRRRAPAARARRAGRAAAADGRRRRHRDGRARHRHGGVSRRRREALPGCVARGARAAARQRSGAHRRARPRSPTSRRCSRSATKSIARARRRRSTPAADAIVIDTTGKDVDEVVREVMALMRQKGLEGWELGLAELATSSQLPALSSYSVYFCSV